MAQVSKRQPKTESPIFYQQAKLQDLSYVDQQNELHQYLEKEMEEHLRTKPSLSIFGQSLDDTQPTEQSKSTLKDPAVPCNTTLHLCPSYSYSNESPAIRAECQRLSHKTFSIHNVTVEYRDFASHYKMWLTFDVMLDAFIDSEPHILVYPFTNRPVEYRQFDALNLYAKIHSIDNIKDSVYRVTALLAITDIVQIEDVIRVFVGCTDAPHYCCTLSVPIRYFSILQQSVLDTVHREFGVEMLKDIYSMIMEYSGRMHWIMECDPFTFDSLDLEDELKINIDGLQRGKSDGVHSVITRVHIQNDRGDMMETTLKGINLLMFHADSNSIETVTVPMRNLTDYLCILHLDSYEDGDRYRGGNNVILKKYLALNMDLGALRNKTDSLEFMLWFEFGETELGTRWRRWNTRSQVNMMCDFKNLVDWYQLKRDRKEKVKREIERQRMLTAKEQRIARQRNRKCHCHSKYHPKQSKYRNHRRNRW